MAEGVGTNLGYKDLILCTGKTPDETKTYVFIIRRFVLVHDVVNHGKAVVAYKALHHLT